jgi:hypothetical protein
VWIGLPARRQADGVYHRIEEKERFAFSFQPEIQSILYGSMVEVQ